MKLKVAIPILLTSASVMVSGLASYALSTAEAQPPIVLPQPTPPGGDGGDSSTKVTPFQTGLEGTDATTTPPGARVSFNLEDADLPDLVRIVARITGKRFILPSKARSIKATVYSPTDVTAAEAYQAFLSILDLNGLTLEPSGRYYKIVETTGVEGRSGLPLYEDGQTMPADDRFVTRMHRLEHVSAEDVATLLGHFKTAEGAITAYAPTNTLIITDTAASVRRMLAIISQVDVARTGEQIWIEPVHYAVATDLVEVLTEMFPPEDGEGGGGDATKAGHRTPRPGKAPVTREGEPTADASSGTVGASAGGEARVGNILADERTNSLIIIATERAYLQILEAVRILDVPVDDEGSVHVYELQYADAENMADVLSSLVGGGGGGASATKSADGGGSGSITGGDVAIQAYKETNSLIITASQSDYASLRRVLEELDIAPRQVFIEAVIMELQVQRTGRLGFNFHGGLQDPSFPEGQGFSVLGFGAATSLGIGTPAMLAGDTLTGLALGVRGPTVTPVPGLSIPSFGAILTAIATSSDVDVLATPHLLAMDNIEAEITVGSNIPLQQNGIGGLGGVGGLGALGALGGLAGGLTGQTGATGATGLGALGALGGLAGGLGGSSALGGGFGAGGRQNVGTTIRITPHINDAGEIRLEIEEEISEAGAPQGSLGVVPIQQRVAKTQVLVRDQQTVVIGGLMRDRVATTEDKIPILGDIPILGALFRRESRTTEKTNLLLFLTPYIIRSADDLRAIFERKMRERQEFLDRYFVFGDHDYEPVLDFSRTRGLVLEIFNELNAIDEERELAEELAERPPPEHHARAPLGEAEPYDPSEGDLVISPDGEETVHGTVVDGAAPQE